MVKSRYCGCNVLWLSHELNAWEWFDNAMQETFCFMNSLHDISIFFVRGKDKN